MMKKWVVLLMSCACLFAGCAASQSKVNSKEQEQKKNQQQETETIEETERTEEEIFLAEPEELPYDSNLSDKELTIQMEKDVEKMEVVEDFK